MSHFLSNHDLNCFPYETANGEAIFKAALAHIGADLILDSSLHFQLKIIKPLKYYLRLFSIVILGAESNSEVKLHLEWVPVGQKWAFLLYFYFLAFWF